MDSCYLVVFDKTEKNMKEEFEKRFSKIGIERDEINWDLFDTPYILENASDVVLIDLLDIFYDKNFSCDRTALELLDNFKLETIVKLYTAENGESDEVVKTATNNWIEARNELYANIF